MKTMEKLIHQVREHLLWYVSLRSPKDIWNKHPTLLFCELLFYTGGILTLKHAVRRGGRFLTLWLACSLHGIMVEGVCYAVPSIGNFWHAQSCIMLFGHRMPLHVIFFYPVVFYTSSVAVSRLSLSWRSEPFAVGIATVLMDVPFDVLGIKHLWWTWHDTDPNIAERSFHVPWSSYYFYTCSGAVLTFLIHGTRLALTGKPKYDIDSNAKEGVCVLLTGFLSTPLFCLAFIPYYYVFYDLGHVSPEIIVSALFVGFFAILWTADRNPDCPTRLSRRFVLDEISLTVMCHYIMHFVLFALGKPENIVSEGLHQQVGPCDQNVAVYSPIGPVLNKHLYLCLTNYNEPYFDFFCLEKEQIPVDGSSWYTICGNPYCSFVEYGLIMGTSCALGLFFFYQLLFRSGLEPVPELRKIKFL